jgi:alkylated DNA repair protein alkB homolog 1
MSGDFRSLDPQARPPEQVRNTYKNYQKLKPPSLDRDEEVIDLSRGLSDSQKREMKIIKQYLPEELEEIFLRFEQTRYGRTGPSLPSSLTVTAPVPVYEYAGCPGTVNP